MMQKKIVNRLVVIPMLLLVVLCAVIIFITSLLVHRGKVYNAIYEKLDYGYVSVDMALADIKTKQLRSIAEIPKSENFTEAYYSGDIESLYAYLRPLFVAEDLDYGLITDAGGSVQLRMHDLTATGGNVSDMWQVAQSLDGKTTTTLIGHDDEPLRISTCAPILDADRNITGTITIGRTLTARGFTNRIKSQTGCDITFFNIAVNAASSTLPFPSMSYIDEAVKEEIIQSVLHDGSIYEGELLFRNDLLLSKMYPLYDTNEVINGMLFVGVPVSDADSELLTFILIVSLVAVIFIVISVFVTIFISKKIIARLDMIDKQMRHRDNLFAAVNQASVVLLQIDETDDIRVPLISCMQLIGLALGVDHVHLWRGQSGESGAHQFVREYSWVSDYGKRKARTPKYLNSTSDRVDLNWMDKFLRNEHISGIIADMEESNKELLRALEVKSIAMIPVFLEDQFWGMFSIDNIQDARLYADDEVEILRSISLMMANIVRRHDLQNENLKVYFDALTGINNRRYFDKSMSRIISSLSRAGNDLGVMMIDVDYFKKYNDTYGHGAGDECLVRVAEILSQSAARVDDFVARYGGEEFVVVMPNTDREGAVSVAKRIIENIRTAAIPHMASDVAEYVTVSIGVTTGKVTQYHTAESFVNRADDLLYKSKNNGRNKYTYGVLK